ncbi:hypothetical protein L2E82_10506 [Cichorium intybus]|uniref:Uncharacterized protein n=1 Tax=Cichorium intybus TaxID=13427 RepID=A0ACB9GAJ2_CICIN|nr:hypothetical protein L2E82_10506 [Cichorium intybus]
MDGTNTGAPLASSAPHSDLATQLVQINQSLQTLIAHSGVLSTRLAKIEADVTEIKGILYDLHPPMSLALCEEEEDPGTLISD